VQRDPLAEVRGLYDWLDEPVTDEFEAGMRRWWAAHAETRGTNVHPEPAEFGLDLEAVRGRFAAYTSRIDGWTSRPAVADDR
jgi:hypothetical protein